MEAEPGIEPRSTALQAAALYIYQMVMVYATRYATQFHIKFLFRTDPTPLLRLPLE